MWAPTVMLRRQGGPQHLMRINAPLSYSWRELSLCLPIVSDLIPKLLISFLIYNLHFIYYLIIDFFLSFSSESFRWLTPRLYFPQYWMPPFFSQMLCEKVITSVFTNFTLNTNTLKYASLFPHHTQFAVFQVGSWLSELFSEPAR